MNAFLAKNLACPVCRRPLAGENGAFRCPSCGLGFPQVHGVPCLFEPGKEDLWAQNQSGLAQYLEENPAVAEALEHMPEETLNGADLTAKSSLRQMQGRLREAAELQQAAWRRCYPPAYIEAFEAQLDFIAARLADCPGPVVDIASGRGMLAARLMERIAAPVVATDLSPSVLHGYQASRWPERLESGRLIHLAFDAAAIPFQDGSLPAVTTCLGLQNIPGPERAIRELRRVCGGALYALCNFFPEDDLENQEAAVRFGLAGAYSHTGLTALLEQAGFRVERFETPAFRQPPTPVGQAVPGLRVDGLPVRETEGKFATLVCT